MDRRIDEIEKQSDGGYFVYLKYGFKIDGAGSENNEQHCFGADTHKEIRSQMGQVVKCTCEECINANK